MIIKKRARHESPLNQSKPKKHQTDDEHSDDDKHIKRKMNLDLSSM